MMRFGRWKFADRKKFLSFDVRDQRISCVVYEGKEIILSQTLPVCSNDEVPIELEKLAVFLKQKGAMKNNSMAHHGRGPFCGANEERFPGRDAAFGRNRLGRLYHFDWACLGCS